MSDAVAVSGSSARPGPLRASLVFVTCLLRGVPLVFRGGPKTPLRVLAIVALDTLHVLRYSQPLPRHRVRQVAWFIDFQGCANAAWDGKTLCEADYQRFQQQLVDAGLGPYVDEYLKRLQELESHRPATGGDQRRFEEVRTYREAVARLAVVTDAAVALNAEPRPEGIAAAECDNDIEMLFRVLMQCQIIDDVLDYRVDSSAGLPSFLTATSSLPDAIALTAETVRCYSPSLPTCEPRIASRELRTPTRELRTAHREPAVLPVRLALWTVTVVTKVVVRMAKWHRAHRHLTWSQSRKLSTGENR